MRHPPDALDRGLALYRALVAEDDALRAEFDGSRASFFPSAPPAPDDERVEARLADRRHLEWFLLERPSEALEGVPAEALAERWRSQADPAERDCAEALLASLAGVFEVTGVDSGRGVWLRDLLGLGEYPIDEPDAAGELARGDLIVGRVFPVGDSLFRVSPAATCYRNAELLDAVSRDLERLRSSRRGALRISQRELERMFHGPGGQSAGAGAESGVESPVDTDVETDAETALDAARALVRETTTVARAFLVHEGLAPSDADDILDELARTPIDVVTPGGGDALGRILDRLAFDTSIDLDRARRLLLAAWDAFAARARALEAADAEETSNGNGAHGANGASNGARGPRRASGRDPSKALEEFDRGRREGRDLDTLFEQLERDLGLEGDAEDEAADVVPDFPGVIGAMIEEFLWDVGRERGEQAVDRLRCLRCFARFGSSIGVFENLSARDLLLFCTTWLFEEDVLSGADDANALLGALAAFCRWAEESHELPLWSAFEPHYRALRQSLPRIAVANRALDGMGARHGEPGPAYELVSLEPDGAAELRAPSGADLATRLDPHVVPWLRPGDFVRAQVRPDDGPSPVARCYPPQAAELFGQGEDAD